MCLCPLSPRTSEWTISGCPRLRASLSLGCPRTSILKPRFPVIDAHNHLGGEFGGGWDNRPVAELLDVLDEAGVKVLVDLDGGWGEAILDATWTSSRKRRRSVSRFSAAWIGPPGPNRATASASGPRRGCAPRPAAARRG